MSGRVVAVVTGASAGVGRATALELARRGFDVALLARGAAGLAAAAAEVEAAGRRALPIEVDVSDAAAVGEAATRVERELGPIEVWVNDAMTTVFAPLSQVEPDEFRRAVEVTFLGQVWGTMAALDHMRPRDRGTIVNVGSALAFIGIPLQSAYCASKFACRGFVESVRSELIHEGSAVRLCMVHLPAVNTPQFSWCRSTLRRDPQPVAPIYQPEVAARAIAEVAIEGRRSKVLGSWNKALVVVASVLPGFGDEFAAISAWDGQLADRNALGDRPVNLWEPVDAEIDHGAHGRFDRQAHGFWSPSFLTTIPGTVRNVWVAGGRALADHARTLRRAVSPRSSRAGSKPWPTSERTSKPQ